MTDQTLIKKCTDCGCDIDLLGSATKSWKLVNDKSAKIVCQKCCGKYVRQLTADVKAMIEGRRR